MRTAEQYLTSADADGLGTATYSRAYMAHCISTAQALTSRQKAELGGWLGPELFNVIAPGGIASDECWLTSDSPLEAMGLRNSAPGQPIRHLTADAGLAWLDGMVATVNEDMRSAHSQGQIRLVGGDQAASARDNLTEALRLLHRVWPAAALETQLLLDAFVYVSGKDYRSGTMHRYLGCVLVGIERNDSVEAALETLLHETGHVVLYLKSSFSRYLRNPDALVQHPLRVEPRPALGALHAAISLFRVAGGFRRLHEAGRASEYADQRWADNCSNLRTVLLTLNEAAEWTAAGEEFYASLCRETLFR